MIWFDGIHMASDESIEELYAEANKIGLKKEWLHNGRIPHFDVWGKFLEKVNKNCSSRELIKQCKKTTLN